MSRNLRRLRHDEGPKETEVVSNTTTRRTFKQEAVINRAGRERCKRIEAEGLRPNVQVKLLLSGIVKLRLTVPPRYIRLALTLTPW